MHNFTINDKQQKKLSKWLKTHNELCSLSNKNLGMDKTPTIGGRLTYCFTPTGLGSHLVVKCTCGKEIDLTDCSNW